MKKLSKEKQNYYKRLYYKSDCESVCKYYKKCSYLKKNAENYIKDEMTSVDGYDYRVLNGNSYKFVCAYKRKEIASGKELLIIHTPSYRYAIEL